MDRTSWIGLIVCILLLVAWNLYVSYKYPIRPPAKQNLQPSPPTSAAPTTPLEEKIPPILTSSPTPPPPPTPSLPPQIFTLQNSHLLIEITSHGGAIHKAQLQRYNTHKHSSAPTPITFSPTQSTPILATLFQGISTSIPHYSLSQNSAPSQHTITATAEILPGLTHTRTYTLQDDYTILLTETFRNTTPNPITIPKSQIHLGHAAPHHSDDRPEFIGSAWIDSQSRYHATAIHNFDGFNLLGLQLSPPKAWTDTGPTSPLWVALRNQYFLILALPVPPTTHFPRAEFRPIVLPQWPGRAYAPPPRGVRADLIQPETPIAPATTITNTLRLYIGPKEYHRIQKLGIETERLMEFGFFSPLVKLLLYTMNAIHHALAPIPPLHSYGLAIVLLALFVKLLLWPLQSAANRSMKKIQALAPKMKELQEKYKDDPQKMQTEMMKLYTDYGVNPIGGCLPLLPQIPIFIAFYSMLQHAIEIRHASFLWVADLSRPDTIYTIPILGLDINPLPILMTATSIFIMHMTPTTAENQQYKIMRWMPLIFLPLFYGFASALSLYWTVNNLVSIIQTYRNLKKPLPVLKRVERKPNSRLAMFQKALEEQRRLQEQQRRAKKKSQ